MIRLWELTPVGQVAQKINVIVNIDKTQHAGERQYRHNDFTFTDDDIKNMVDIALPKMSKEIMFNHINVGDNILIKHKDLNIVGNLSLKSGQLEYTVITLMKKDFFQPKSGTKVIEV